MSEKHNARVRVDRSVCQATGVCESIAPAIFSVNDEALLEVHEELATSADVELAERAVISCPTRALSLEHQPSP